MMNQLIDSVPFFGGFSEDEKRIIINSDSYFESFEAEDRIIEEGSRDSVLYIIIKGKAVVTKNSHPDRIIATLEAGTVMGELSFLTNRPRSTNVTATTKVVCFTLNSETMKLLDSSMQHKIKDQLIDILVRRLDEMNCIFLSLLR